MQSLLDAHQLVLMEAAVVERLRREAGVALHPRLEHAALIYDDTGRRAMRDIFGEYVSIAQAADLPLLVCTPTWRANRERVAASHVPETVNADAVAFVAELLAGAATTERPVRVGGLIGCKNDCYRPDEGLTSDAAEAFHAWQLEQLARAGVDFLMAATLPALPEALGIARALDGVGIPYVVSFVIDRGGCLLDGTELGSAIERVDAATAAAALGFMVNCAHPSFLRPGRMRPATLARLIGVQANASSLDHAALDGATDCHVDDVDDWAARMMDLNRRCGVRILGGCCGTGPDHLRAIVRAYEAR